jgi:hypothetical protein
VESEIFFLYAEPYIFGSVMKLTKSMGRPLLLLALFIYGILLIWHIGHNLFPQSEHLARQIVPVPAARESK